MLVALLASILVACGSSTLPTPLPTLPPDTPEPTATSALGTPGPEGTCTLPPLRYRAAQVLLMAVPGTEPDETNAELVRKGIGGVLLFGANLVDADQVRTLTNGLQAEAEVPLAIAVDEEGGRVARLAAAGILAESPAARTLGKQKAAAIREAARTIGDGLVDLGITVDLAPVLDVTGEAADGVIGDRSFGSSAKAVARSGVAFAQGLLDAGVAPVGKHFPGHGETTVDSHTGLPVVSTPLDELARARSSRSAPRSRPGSRPSCSATSSCGPWTRPARVAVGPGGRAPAGGPRLRRARHDRRSLHGRHQGQVGRAGGRRARAQGRRRHGRARGVGSGRRRPRPARRAA